MINVTDRSPTLRRATAEAVVTMRPETLERIRSGEVPKGDVAAITKGVGLLGLKRTSELLPFCHSIPLGHADVRMSLEDDHVRIEVEVATIALTGVEVEAMTGAAVAALNVYDMIKPIDKQAAIGHVRVLQKSGGRSHWRQSFEREIRAGVLVVSDKVSQGKAEDSAGAAVAERLQAAGVSVAAFEVRPDEPEQLAELVRAWSDEQGFDLAVAVGGTGLGPRDRTPEALRPLFEREIPGVGEAVRAHGRQRTPYADLSRTLAGQRGRTLIIGTAGSAKAASESMEALLPWVLHVIKVFDKAYRHEDMRPEHGSGDLRTPR